MVKSKTSDDINNICGKKLAAPYPYKILQHESASKLLLAGDKKFIPAATVSPVTTLSISMH